MNAYLKVILRLNIAIITGFLANYNSTPLSSLAKYSDLPVIKHSYSKGCLYFTVDKKVKAHKPEALKRYFVKLIPNSASHSISGVTEFRLHEANVVYSGQYYRRIRSRGPPSGFNTEGRYIELL